MAMQSGNTSDLRFEDIGDYFEEVGDQMHGHQLHNGKVRAVRRELGSDAHALASDFGAVRDSLGTLFRSLLREGKQSATGATEMVRKKAKNGLSLAEGKIKARPFSSVLGAMLVGLFIGRVVLRS